MASWVNESPGRDVLKKGRLQRLGQLSGALAGTAGLLVGAIVGGAEQRHRLAAERLAEALGDMKGLPMKLGQMLSYLDDALPEEQREIWREVLGRLQAHTPTFDHAAMVAVIEEELGSLDTHFSRFDPEALAAASIGQVYGAALMDGTEVVVKVQYPGIAEAIRADLANVEVLVRSMSTLLRNGDILTLMSGVFERLLEETDYRAEARSQQDFAAAWAEDPDVVVADIVPELCTERVLVMTRIDGQEWAPWLAQADVAEKRAAGRTLFRFVFTSLYGRGWFNADPHPGNYLFLGGGRVAFLDFGCVERYPPEVVAGLQALTSMAAAGTLEGTELRAALDAVFDLPPDLGETTWEILEDFAILTLEPLSAPQPYRFERSYTERLTRRVLAAKLALSKGALRHGVPVPRTRGIVFISRVSFGLANLLATLEAEEDWLGVLNAGS